jgi:putative lipoic acid-binding regulatory protein
MSDEEARLRELLESQHTFPGPYSFKVICRSSPMAQDAIIAGVRERTGLALSASAAGMRPSRNGNYVSLNLTLHANLAQDVLDVYACLRTFDSVLQYF